MYKNYTILTVFMGKGKPWRLTRIKKNDFVKFYNNGRKVDDFLR